MNRRVYSVVHDAQGRVVIEARTYRKLCETKGFADEVTAAARQHLFAALDELERATIAYHAEFEGPGVREPHL